ncbi:MAG: 2-C-methyl-D-erythritol 4-phosphate cytidylyltransferase [Planctomycetes bacterium]|nr:2-C-methyl-D-erythritol 4-phosphate cytidylyltransferase [Planctomycetota bacterium]
MKDITVIIAAAGESKRLKAKVHKPYLTISGKPVLLHSIRTFSRIPSVQEIIIAVNPKDRKRAQSLIHSIKVVPARLTGRQFGQVRLVTGGATRQESVANGLKAVSPNSHIVLIHDAARPFVTRSDVIRLIKAVRRTGAAILAIPVVDTIKRVSQTERQLIIEETITPRKSLWAAQTPQGFKKEILIKALSHPDTKCRDATDDSFMVEMMGYPVTVVKGSEKNIKITAPADLSRRF